MNYRHIYHAGNFADVFKHCILSLLLAHLLQKDKPFCYIDTHGGIGIYDLYSEPAQKTLEYLGGVACVLNAASENIPEAIAPYLDLLKKVNKTAKDQVLTGSNIHFYPGSPLVARSFLRSCDNMVVMELHPEDVLSLKKLFAKDPQVAIHHYNGYQGLKAFLPPPKRRGLVLIDPPFEQKNEFDVLLAALNIALHRWPAGIYAIWYPIKDIGLVNNFIAILTARYNKYLISELTIHKQTALKEFIGCGMAIINPPWQFEITIKKVLPWLGQILSPKLEGEVKILMS